MYVKRDEAATQAKIEEMRKRVSEKMTKWGNTLQVSMAIPDKVERKNGDTWTDAKGKTWEMKDGIARTVSVTQEARMPWWCPKCNKAMNHRFDRKFYYLRGWCFNCNIEFEGQLRVEGKWEEYERNLVRENEKAFLKDRIQEVLAYITEFKEPQIYFEDGRWEKLATKSQFVELFETLMKDVEIMEARLEVILKEETNDKVYNDSGENINDGSGVPTQSVSDV